MNDRQVKDCRTTIRLSLLKVSNLFAIHCGCNGSLNAKNQMCELCTFSQIWSHYVLMHFTLLQKNPLYHYKEFYKNWSISSPVIIFVVLHLLAYTRIIHCSVSTHIQLCFLFFDKPVDYSCWSFFSSSFLLYNCFIKLSIRWSFSSVSLLTNLQFVHII